jgi:hypothetical protein
MLVATLLASAAVWVALGVRIVGDPVNHVGTEPLLALIPFALLAIVSWLPRYRHRRILRAVVTSYAVLSVVAVGVLDSANVLVQYERWAQRGMPERPCGDILRHVWSCRP